MLPPQWVRRVVIAPVVAGLLLAGLLSFPLWGMVALALSPLVPGHARPLRLAWFVVLYAIVELCTLTALFGLWIATCFGAFVLRPWSQRAHYIVLRWMLVVLEREADRVLHARIVVEGASLDDLLERPVVVLARHAGMGDSFLVIHELMTRYHRDPRIVLKDTLQWDPAIDVILNRLPNRFITPNPGTDGRAVASRISELASNLDGDDALVIFPEGGNFTPKRRLSAIARLRERGLASQARRAERLTHVLAPRPGGATAALTSAPGADAMLVAHTGLEHLDSLRGIWEHLPMDREVRMHWWRVPRDEIPRDEEGCAAWLDAWWHEIDRWIAAHHPGDSSAERLAAAAAEMAEVAEVAEVAVGRLEPLVDDAPAKPAPRALDRHTEGGVPPSNASWTSRAIE